MGATNHERLLPLNGRTIQQVWDEVHDQEGYENGHSYSGDFGSKGGFTLVVKDPRLTKELLSAAGELVSYLNAEGDFTPDAGAMPVVFVNAGDMPDWDPRHGKNAEIVKQAEALIGLDNLRVAAHIYDDKWGDAAAIAGADYVWFGGFCPE
jgi:hypothetical protein